MKYVDVILPLALGKPLTYGVPVDCQGLLRPGMRVEVQLGKTKLYSGLVYRVHDDRPVSYQIKPIRNIIDQEPIVSAAQLQLWEWISTYYMSSIGAVMQAALPAHFKLMNENVLAWNEALHDIPQGLSDNGYLLAEILFHKKKLTIEEIRKLLDGKLIAKVLDELLIHEVVYVYESLDEKYKPKKEKLVRFTPAFEKEEAMIQLMNGLSRSPKKLGLIFKFIEMNKSNGLVPAATLLKNSNTTTADLNVLVNKGVFEITEINVDRLLFSNNQEPLSVTLSEEQDVAYQGIKDKWQQQHVVLLHGITGSGKTMVYIRLIKEAIEKGKQVLLLLPEIALTTHLLSRLVEYFGKELGVYHSRFSDNERIEIWNNVRNNNYKIVVGARSAIWLPFQDLDCIIVDEEHESSYKQVDPAPRFQARDTAIVYAQMKGAKVLLGSATPSIETYRHVVNEKYGLVTLTKRYSEIALPMVQLVEARDLIPALSSIITKPLLDEIAHTINKGKQVILFQNKRGYAPFLICNSCGWIAKCKNCDVSITFHKASDKLHCHYCAAKYKRMHNCEQCGSSNIGTKSFGTERVEEELNRVFPNVKVGRLDWDAVKGKNAYQQIINDFEIGKIQILVGTQMVVKGLDFENVNLVGVLSADSILGFPDYRVNERAFQLLEQVAGRAGRKNEIGKVLIQAYKTDHPVLIDVVNHDYFSFYKREIAFRKELYYPPIVKFIKVMARHIKDEVASTAIGYFVTYIMDIPNILINGPAPAVISRVRNQYIYEVWIKTSRNEQEVIAVKQRIAQAIDQTKAVRGMSSVYFLCDVDP